MVLRPFALSICCTAKEGNEVMGMMVDSWFGGLRTEEECNV